MFVSSYFEEYKYCPKKKEIIYPLKLLLYNKIENDYIKIGSKNFDQILFYCSIQEPKKKNV